MLLFGSLMYSVSRRVLKIFFCFIPVAKSGVVENLLSWATFKQSKDLKKSDGTKADRVQVEKLEDANKAGGKESQRCTLILTEGDSAKALAVSGF